MSKADEASPVQGDVMGICPRCHHETLCITVTGGGKGYNDYWGQEEHWFEGNAKCSCGYEGYYSDSSL